MAAFELLYYLSGHYVVKFAVLMNDRCRVVITDR